MADNPYAAPVAAVDDINDTNNDYELAGRGSRLLAAIVNGLIVGIPAIAVAIAVPAMSQGKHVGSGAAVVLALFGIYIIIIVIIDIVLLYRNGQTIGKRLMEVKIARQDGSRCELWRILVLRLFVNGLISGIPFIGKVYGLVDVLLIFGKERRCVHDYIADTIVIKA